MTSDVSDAKIDKSSGRKAGDVSSSDTSSRSPLPVSDHCDGKRFFNPTLPKNFPLAARAYKMIFAKRGYWPSFVRNEGLPQLHEKLGDADVAITYVNHATFLIQMPGVNILTDPIWSKRASPFRWIGPRRVRNPGVALDELPKIDVILISHNHYDHLDLATLKKLSQKHSSKVFVAMGDKKLVESAGLRDVRELDWWEDAQINSELKITFTPTQHFSARGLFDRLRSLWGGYMIQSAGRRIYFGGDSAYSTHFSEIKERLGSPDIALLGIGAYEPRWFMKPMHMNPQEAVQAHLDLGSNLSIGMHTGTFRMSAEAFDQPKQDLKTAIQKMGISNLAFTTLQEGETRIFSVQKR